MNWLKGNTSTGGIVFFLSLFDIKKKNFKQPNPRNGLLARKVYRHKLTSHSAIWNEQSGPAEGIPAHSRSVGLGDL